MEVKPIIHANGQTVFAWGTVGRAAVVTALAAIIFLTVWSPISAGVTQGALNSSGAEFVGAPLSGGSDFDSRTKEAERLASDNSEWFRAAHSKAGLTAEAQPLPAQF